MRNLCLFPVLSSIQVAAPLLPQYPLQLWDYSKSGCSVSQLNTLGGPVVYAIAHWQMHSMGERIVCGGTIYNPLHEQSQCQRAETQPKPWSCCRGQCLVTQAEPWSYCGGQCLVTQAEPWSYCRGQCLVTQAEPWSYCWCQCAVTQPEPRQGAKQAIIKGALCQRS